MSSNGRLKYREGAANRFLHHVLGQTTQLKRALSGYEGYCPPFIHLPSQLNDDQAAANFEFFIQTKDERLAMVGALLGQFGVWIETTNLSVKSLNLMDEWAYQQWPQVYVDQLGDYPIPSFDQSGFAHKVRSMLFDVSILLGECFRAYNPQARWIIDNSLSSKEQQSMTINRIVMSEPPTDTRPVSSIIDFEDQVFFHYKKAQIKSDTLIQADSKIGRVLAEPILRLILD